MIYQRIEKYQLAAQKLHGMSGTLMDVGSRDRILSQYLPETVTYHSADITPGHDFQWNLELPLLCSDNAFDFVVAFDVLEHVENIHQATAELIRITRRRLFITLPNMSNLASRIRFLRTGFLAPKYALLPTHQGDRHRWLTTYPEIITFIASIAVQERGCQMSQVNLIYANSRWEKLMYYLPLSPATRTHTVFFDISKNANAPPYH
ncbi:MAG: methyltransferase domain-containing protein [Patescibacteria group bacterium]